MVDVIKESRRALKRLDWVQIDSTAFAIGCHRRVFCVGNGGGYAHAMHFASDLRKIAHKQAFSFDNAAEMTARINDQGWEDSGREWLDEFDFDPNHDSVFAFSCGGGQDGVSQNLPLSHWGIGGANSNLSIIIPSTSTPVIEGCQSVIAHHIVEQLCK